MTLAKQSQANNKDGAEIVLSVTCLSRSFGGVHAVSNMSFELQKGSITGLIGPNGAGKSTLFNLVTGVDRSQSGQVVLNGEDVTGLPSYKLARRGMIRTFQLSREFSGLTVLENLMLSPSANAVSVCGRFCLHPVLCDLMTKWFLREPAKCLRFRG